MVTLGQVRADAAPDLYPRHLLECCDSALVLFASAFHGQQDAVWVAEAGLVATCVDIDEAKLGEMRDVYPDGWEFVASDAFEFATRTARQWDIVSVDCPTNLFAKCAALTPLWCRLARRAVVLGTGTAAGVVAPEGWEITESRLRSLFRGGTFWTVLEREAS